MIYICGHVHVFLSKCFCPHYQHLFNLNADNYRQVRMTIGFVLTIILITVSNELTTVKCQLFG